MRRFFIFAIFAFFSISLSFADAEASVIQLRDLLYAQELSSQEIFPYYEKTLSEIQNEFSEKDSGYCFALSARTEYFMGRVYQLYEEKDSACEHYEKGIELADKSLSVEETALAYIMKAECISQLCAIHQASYAISNGLKVINYADDALNLDENNTAAIYLKASRWIYAPQMFSNQAKGRKILSENFKFLKPENKDDVFNYNLAMGYSYLTSKNNSDALTYLKKALEVYPTNKYCMSLLKDASEQ